MNYAKIIMLMVLSNSVVSAYIYDIKVLRKWVPEYKRYHYFIGCCDFHDKTHPVNESQRKKIEELIRSTDKKDVHISIEDLSSSKNNALIAGTFYINSNAGILANLANYCMNRYIPFTNIEYRFSRVAALGPVINNLHLNPAHFPSARKITIGMLKKEIVEAIKELEPDVKNNSKVSAEYAAKVKQINQTMKKLQFNAFSDASVADYMNAFSTPVNRLEVIKHLLTFDGILVGLNMSVVVVKNGQKQKNIAFAGGTHIKEAYDILRNCDGWQEVTHSGLGLFKEHNLQKCVGSNIINGSYCLKPQPVSLELLEHYLKN